uniref:SF3 helicase domain-containing protein n=1 Tax=viral metagenome TaxID=1070528 RepID=A0A6C0AYG7_9ZZZZ|tara:strand:+ start:9252 stop:11984 length:2733 start_codon:yes stop_codon:yes gene_type:complete
MSNQSVTLDEYLKRSHIEKGETYTHTRIGDKENKISGGLYNIKDKKVFLEKYFQHVFVDGKKEYLTEKQRIEDAPLVIDIDMRYSVEIKERQHTKDHIIDLIDIYTKAIYKLFNVPDNFKIEVFVMEKSTVNIMDNKTKDGIHIIFGILMHKAAQIMLREIILPELKDVWDDLPLTNDIDELVDDGVTRGTVNWQMYGSRKPNHKAYLIKYFYNVKWIEEKHDWNIIEMDVDKFDIKNNLYKLSVQCSSFPKLDLNEKYSDDFNKILKNMDKKKKKSTKIIVKEYNNINYKDINSSTQLDELIENLFSGFEQSPSDYELKETHDFTMILPKQYWDVGSYNKWIRVGWALKNTNVKLLPTWLKFSSQSKEFEWSNIGELIELWENFDYDNPDGLTSRSIMFWAKNDNLKEYIKVRETTVSYFMDLTVTHATEWDFAQVLYQMCKDEFVCVSIKNNIWYEYIKHRWYEIDSGNTLRLIISKKMHDMYMKKTTDAINALQKIDQTDDNYDTLKKRSNKLADICILLKKTNWKNNIMREAKELFYDKNFLNYLDNNPYLLCFNNYVVDFKNKIYRTGQPDDYISKSTNIDYIPFEEIKDDIIEEIYDFMKQLFPNDDLRKYMWEHLASTLIGNNDNQTFNIYTGSGRNGKSKLVDLMSKVLGDYKATVPITLVTQKRNNIGSTSSEIVQLMGVRYAVMQEPCKGEKINEGIMKEITGGDPIQGRALFKEAVTFIPQFKLVVCTNTLFDIKSNDDGTWRRIRVCDFMSKFLEDPYGDEEKFPKEDYPYQYAIDKKIDEKFTQWAPVLASILVKMAYTTCGTVNDCSIVMGSSDQYREGQDYLTEFCKEKIKQVKGGKIKKTELWEVFKQWYTNNYGKGLPKAREVNDFMDKRYGKYNTKWNNVMINYDDDDDDED